MNKYFYKLLFLILFIIIIIFFNEYTKINKEGFIPKKLKEMYRPMYRNIRINYEYFYKNLSTKINNFLKKIGFL
jgi:hypothetical protein